MIVLNYHHVHDEDENFFRVTTKQFERQMQYILDCGYTFVTLDQFLERPDAPASVLVTFDDGYEDVYYNAAPILERLKIPALMFLIAGYIGKWNDWDAHAAPSRRRHMNEAQVFDILRESWTIGSHSMNHPDLRQLDKTGLETEIALSKKALFEKFRAPIRAFAYPGGHSNEYARLLTQQHYAEAFSVQQGSGQFDVPRQDPSDRSVWSQFRPSGSWGFLASARPMTVTLQ